MPVTIPSTPHRSLRDRCAVNFSINVTSLAPMPISFVQPKRSYTWIESSPSYHGPRRDSLPRRKAPKKHPCVKEEVPVREEEPVKVAEGEEDGEEFSCLQEIVPGLSVTFSDGPSSPTRDVNATPPRDFTHIISIIPTALSDTSGTVFQWETDQGVQGLDLNVPMPIHLNTESPCEGTTGRGQLTDHQLRAARDFLSLALPYRPSSDSSSDDGFIDIPSPSSDDYDTFLQSVPPPSPRSPNVLIHTPGLFPGLAMSIASCYLAWSSRVHVNEVLKYIEEDDTIMGFWKDTIRWEEGNWIESVARSAV